MFKNKGSFQKRDGFDRPRKSFDRMFDAVCAECGNNCQVPFKPNGSKPILCSNCFEKSGNGGERRSFDDRPPRREFSPRPNSDMREIKEKLDMIIDILTNR